MITKQMLTKASNETFDENSIECLDVLQLAFS